MSDEIDWPAPYQLNAAQLKTIMMVEQCDAVEAREWYRRFYETKLPGARELLLGRYLDAFALARLRGTHAP